MRLAAKLAFLMMVTFVRVLCAQDLAPRAYLITPIHSNAITLTESFLSGGLTFDGSVPITGATARVSLSLVNYSHSFRLFGRTANFLAVLPYGVGNFKGTVLHVPAKAYRSGLLDSAFRLAVNLKGGPAMDLREFSQWRQTTILGASLKVVPPTGQYDPKDLLNFGANRWAFKPELGYSRRLGHWVLDGYGAMWFFTENHEFFSHNQYSPGVNVQTQNPTAACELHLSYDVKPRLWASLDGNFWYGGRTSINGVEGLGTLQRNSRLGATFSLPVSKHQSMKFSYSNGAYIRYGGNYQSISVAWQFSWLRKPS